MELGDKHLKVQRASIGATQASGLEMGVNAMSMLAGTTSNDLEEGRVLQLLNMVTPEELIDNADYEGTIIHANPFFVSKHLLTKTRNLRRRQRRMRKIRPSPRNESPPTQRWQQAIQRRRQDLRQIRQCGFGAQGIAGVGGEEVCGSDCRDYVFC